MKLAQLSIRDANVQDFLWDHLVPTDIRWDYTKIDAIKEVEREVLSGDCQIWGDLDAGIVLRCVIVSPKVIEPHVMGKAVHLREALRQGAEIAWGLGVEVVRIWTQHEAIARICAHCGFSEEAVMPKSLMGPNGNLQTLYTLTKERPNDVY